VYEEEGADNKDSDTNPLNHIDLYETYRNAFLNVTADRKEEAEQLKNEG
jgi:small glutamine-rich tetratricopeptide repeat-containing protein alpha